MISHKILQLYNQKLDSLKLDFDESKVNTVYGKTNVLILGNAKKPPLVLVHGLNSAAPFAIDKVSFFTDKYQVFVIDVLGQPNKSEFVRLNKKGNSYGAWLLDIIAYLKIKNVTYLGISFGAFPILKSLFIDDKSAKQVFLISPAGLINGSLWQTIFKFLIPLKIFQKTKKEKYLRICLSSFYDDFDADTLNFYKEVFLNFDIDFSLLPNFTTQEISSIKKPITIISSKNDYFVPAKKLKKKYDENNASIKDIIILKHSKHIPSKELLEKVFRKLTSQIDT